MKLTINNSELVTLIKNVISEKINEVVVSDNSEKDNPFLILCDIRTRLKPETKIACIKELRDKIQDMSLASAKYLMECPLEKAFAYYQLNKTLLNF